MRRPLSLALLAAASLAWAAPPLEPATAARVMEEVRRPGASAVLVNVWATWCVPCREEFPDLLRLRRAYADRGLRLVLVSADLSDGADEARAFLAAQGVDFPSFHKDEDDQAFIDGLSATWSGALPASFLFDGSGTLRESWEAKASYETLESKIGPLVAGGPRKQSP
jgi:thiol-disulfide isomerase/thioredoxin